MTITRFAPCTRSIAPPMPLTILPGIIQFARSPDSETCIAPRTARSMCPPRIMPNESAESKNDAPGSTVTVSLPALIRSASSCALKRIRAHPEDAVLALQRDGDVGRNVVGDSVGKPMPRFTYCPSRSSCATRAASCVRVSATRYPTSPQRAVEVCASLRARFAFLAAPT